MKKIRRIRFSIRLLLIVIGVLAVLMAWDQAVEKSATSFSQRLISNPKQCAASADTVKIEKTTVLTTLQDRLLGRRGIAVYYTAESVVGKDWTQIQGTQVYCTCLLYTSPSPRD